MNQRNNNILKELRELSPTLAAIPRVNVFKVPEGYFETLPALLLLQTGEVDIAVGSAVPNGYFDSLSSNIMARIKAEAVSDTKPSSALVDSIGNKNVFKVPENYFDGLAATIMNRINAESSTDVLAETNSISSIVAGIGKRNVFTVPEGYFETLSNKINARNQPSKVVRMNFSRNIVRYAAAAVVTGFLAVSAFFIFNKTEKVDSLASQNPAIMDAAAAIIKTNSFEQEMANLNDADIVNFLESKGQDVDAALVASLTEDDKTLPEAEDYLINENTLDEVLKNLDLNN